MNEDHADMWSDIKRLEAENERLREELKQLQGDYNELALRLKAKRYT